MVNSDFEIRNNYDIKVRENRIFISFMLQNTDTDETTSVILSSDLDGDNICAINDPYLANEYLYIGSEQIFTAGYGLFVIDSTDIC